MPDKVQENLERQNNRILAVIMGRLAKIGKMSAADARQFAVVLDYGADLKKIEDIITQTNNITRKRLDDIFKDIAEENEKFALSWYKAKKGDIDTEVIDRYVEAMKRVTENKIVNTSDTYAFLNRDGSPRPIRETYISAIDEAVTAVTTGADSYYTALAKTVRTLAASGVRRVEWANEYTMAGNRRPEGKVYTRRADSSARMNILDATRQVNEQIQEQIGEQLGADGVQITAHALCAPDHLHINGKKMSRTEFDKVQEQLFRKIGRLNCRHSYVPCIMDISPELYSENDIKDYNDRSTSMTRWGDKRYTRYEASQKQRQAETRIRYAREKLQAFKKLGDEKAVESQKAKVKELLDEYKENCEQAKLTPRYNRTNIFT